jgi:hypothetical protein
MLPIHAWWQMPIVSGVITPGPKATTMPPVRSRSEAPCPAHDHLRRDRSATGLTRPRR